ncbi:MAG: pantoate--beta-alanine ligase [bacterium]|nr:pantoate--beta-alanine ligase [bacterium]
MLIYNTIFETRSEIRDILLSGKTIGLVPTMGALHRGHISLLKKARQENDIVVLSIFINPIQFSKGEDLDKYPQTFEEDCKLALEAGTDIVFAPTSKEMYPDQLKTKVKVLGVTEYLCGEKRANHFTGVTTVIAKFLNIVPCDNIYFGQKDYQQFLVVKQIINDLNFPAEIVLCPIVRDYDGLALSSRNRYLNKEERQEALCLKEALDAAKDLITAHKIREVKEIEYTLIHIFECYSLVKLEYIFIGIADNLEPITKIPEGRKVLIALAVSIGETRLIDNLLLQI